MENINRRRTLIPLILSLAAVLTVWVSADSSNAIIVDGDLSDWAALTPMTNSSAQIDGWRVARDADGNVYLAYTGTSANQWDYTYTQKALVLERDGRSMTIQVEQVKNASWVLKSFGNFAVVNDANLTTAGPYAVEVMIPAENFSGSSFRIGLGDDANSAAMVSADDIPVLHSAAAPAEREAVYEGIAVDGAFSDWDAVTKYDAEGKTPNNNLSRAAMVFDGDMVYIYLEEKEGTSLAGSGSHSNGKFTISTDLGYETLFTLGWNGEVNGIEGARASHVGRRWEIAVPKSCLQNYLQTISLGLYQGETLVADVSNRDGSTGNADVGNKPSFSGITYDGLYGDWNNYPHHTIQYATGGTQGNLPDASGALYSDGDAVYGHVVTRMPAHLQEAGQEFTEAVRLKFDAEGNWQLNPRLVAVDANGNINWNPRRAQLAPGTYEFYIADLSAWGSSANINSLNEHDTLYGRMQVTVGTGKDECEFYLDMDKLAGKFGADPHEFREISAQFGRIGQEWLTTSGASSGPWLGVALSCATAGAALLVRGDGKKRREAAAV